VIKMIKNSNLSAVFLLVLLLSNSSWSEISSANWMRDLGGEIANTRLRSLFIPSSHDAATYYLSDEMAKNQDLSDKINIAQKVPLVGTIVFDIVKKWAATQNLNIYTQLDKGIRSLDLRVVYRDQDKDFYIVHGLFGPKFSDVLEQISRFLREHPLEIVLISIGDLRYMGDSDSAQAANHRELISRIKAALGDKMLTLAQGKNPAMLTVKQVQDTRKQVILSYNNDKYTKAEEGIWKSGEISNGGWVNAQNLPQLESRNIVLLAQRKQAPTERFSDLSLILTPSTDNIVHGIFNSLNPAVCKSVGEMGVAVKSKLTGYLNKWRALTDGAVVSYDFVDEGFTRQIFMLNQKSYVLPAQANFGAVCALVDCPDGFTDSGPHCLKSESKGRGWGYALWDDTKCHNENPATGCEKCLAMYYPRCGPGYKPVGCNICEPICPAHTKDVGLMCEKQAN